MKMLKASIKRACVVGWLAIGVGFMSAPADAQPVLVNQNSGVNFTASPDHSLTTLVGTVVVNIVTDYSLTVYTTNTSGPIAFTYGLGKPVPDAANLITVKPLSTTASPFGTLPPGSYVATVQSNGPGGSGVSVASDPFGRVSTPRAGGKPAAVP